MGTRPRGWCGAVRARAGAHPALSWSLKEESLHFSALAEALHELLRKNLGLEGMVRVPRLGCVGWGVTGADRKEKVAGWPCVESAVPARWELVTDTGGVVDKACPGVPRDRVWGQFLTTKPLLSRVKCSFDFLPSSPPPPFSSSLLCEQGPHQPRGLPRDPRRRPGAQLPAFFLPPAALGLGVGVRWARPLWTPWGPVWT